MKHLDPKKLYRGEELVCRTQIGGYVHSFSLHVLDMDGQGFITDVPRLGGPVLEPGQEVLIRYLREDSAYQFLAVILDFACDGERDFLCLSYPMQITRYQRRLHERLPIDGTVRFSLPTQPGERGRGFILDLSPGGAKFVTRQPRLLKKLGVPVGKKILMDILFPNGTEVEGLTAEIRRIHADSAEAEDVEVQVEFLVGSKMLSKLQQTLRRISDS